MSVLFQPIVRFNSRDLCPICWQDFTQNSDAIGHWIGTSEKVEEVFHRSCLVQWLVEHPVCPKCQKPIDSRTYDLFTEKEDRARAAVLAAQNGHEAIVELLINSDDDGRALAAVAAAQNGHPEIMLRLINSDKVRGVAAIMASAIGDINIIMLLNEETIPDEYRSLAVMHAEINGHEFIRHELIHSAINWDYVQARAAVLAGQHGYQEIMLRLVDLDRAYSDRIRGLAVIDAAKNGDRAIIEQLLANGCISDTDSLMAADVATSPDVTHFFRIYNIKWICKFLLFGTLYLGSAALLRAAWLAI